MISVYDQLVIIIPGGYLAMEFAEETTDAACPAHLPNLTVEVLSYEPRRSIEQATAGDGGMSSEVTDEEGSLSGPKDRAGRSTRTASAIWPVEEVHL